MLEKRLTFRSAVSEKGHEQWHIVNVLQVGTDLMDATRQLGLQKGGGGERGKFDSQSWINSVTKSTPSECV